LQWLPQGLWQPAPRPSLLNHLRSRFDD
jgi:hypothetical protein